VTDSVINIEKHE